MGAWPNLLVWSRAVILVSPLLQKKVKVIFTTIYKRELYNLTQKQKQNRILYIFPSLRHFLPYRLFFIDNAFTASLALNLYHTLENQA